MRPGEVRVHLLGFESAEGLRWTKHGRCSALLGSSDAAREDAARALIFGGETRL